MEFTATSTAVASDHPSQVIKQSDIFLYTVLFALKKCSPKEIITLAHVCKSFYQNVSLLDDSIICCEVDDNTVNLINGIHNTRRMIRLRYDCKNKIDYGFDGEFYINPKNDVRLDESKQGFFDLLQRKTLILT